MRVRVTGAKTGYATTARDSAQTSAVAAGTLSGKAPWITGTLRAGHTQAAHTSGWTAGTALHYQWYRSGAAIRGATGKYYRLTTADGADTIKVRVTGVKAGYNSLVTYSGSTRRVP